MVFRQFRFQSDKTFILFYFFLIIIIGACVLVLPFSWNGPEPLSFIDALFTSTSAVCVTGLITVDTTLYSKFGQLVIMLLIQTGGLGIIAFAMIYIVNSRKRVSIMNSGIIRDYYVAEVGNSPRMIIKDIVIRTFIIEILGACFLMVRFRYSEHAVFNSLFHAVSAFCNAGFSTFPDNLESYILDPVINMTIMSLVVLGGIGFIVMRDVGNLITGRSFRISAHSKAVLIMTGFLISAGFLAFFFLEYEVSMKALTLPQKILASLFQSVTPRTAGFDTIIQSKLSQPSVFLTMLLMFIGASPASTGGGIKTTTFFVLVLAAFREPDNHDRMKLGNRSIPARKIIRALSIAVKGLLIVLIATFGIMAAQSIAGKPLHTLDIIFESISAFGTVGLSLGITSSLSSVSKCILILAMFSGRVGLFAMSLPKSTKAVERFAGLPSTDLLIG